MTFSIVALDVDSKCLGVAVASGSIAVGSRVPWISDLAAIATQAYTNILYGSEGLKLISQGMAPEQALEILLSKDPNREYRQVAMIDIKNRKAVFTGTFCPSWKGHIIGSNFVIIGNLIVSENVLKCIEQEFTKNESEFDIRLVSALLAGEEAGGDKRGDRSAAVLIKCPQSPFELKIRIDNDKEPARRLYEKLTIYNK